ncbi:MAG: hypothetical protein ACKVOM_08215 [Ferruginibacter sp.]
MKKDNLTNGSRKITGQGAVDLPLPAGRLSGVRLYTHALGSACAYTIVRYSERDRTNAAKRLLVNSSQNV